MGCIMPVGGAPLAMGWGRGGGADETSGGDTPTGRGGRGSGGTPGREAEMGAIEGMPGEKHVYSTDIIIRHFETRMSYYQYLFMAEFHIKYLC